ncbi:MAG: nucleotidyltransferase family protein [Bacteroidota bacterium]
MPNNWAIILAAGSSRRMGTQKLLLPFRKSTIIETVVDHVLSSKIKNVLVVLGPDPQKVKDVLAQKDLKFCHNQHHEEGMLSSVICGIRALPDEAEAALIYLGDQPEISAEVTNRVMEAYNDELFGIVIPVYNYRRGHPLLVDMKYRREIEKLDLEQGLRALRHHFPEDVLEVEVDEPGILVDIDTQEDYSNATKK